MAIQEWRIGTTVGRDDDDGSSTGASTGTNSSSSTGAGTSTGASTRTGTVNDNHGTIRPDGDCVLTEL